MVFRCWLGREHLPDCHNYFVKRYHWPFGYPFLGFFIRISMDRLTKRSNFYSPGRENSPKKQRLRGKKK